MASSSAQIYRIVPLAVPGSPTPVVSGKLIRLSLNPSTTCAIAFLAAWLILLNAHISITETDDLFLTALASFHNKLLPTLNFTAGDVALHLGFIWHYLRFSGLTFLGFPAGCPSFFFCDMRERF